MATEYCRHIRPNGTRCRSLALTGQVRCYWHTGLTQRHLTLTPPPVNIPPHHASPEYLARNPLVAEYYAPRPLELDFPELEDRSSIQLALSMVLGALARNRIDSKRAGPILYGLQVASSNIRDLQGQPSHPVRSPSFDDQGQPIAPDEDPEEIIEAQLFLEDYEADLKKQEEDEDYESPYDDD
jgi:hypothetical protein